MKEEKKESDYAVRKATKPGEEEKRKKDGGENKRGKRRRERGQMGTWYPTAHCPLAKVPCQLSALSYYY